MLCACASSHDGRLDEAADYYDDFCVAEVVALCESGIDPRPVDQCLDEELDLAPTYCAPGDPWPCLPIPTVGQSRNCIDARVAQYRADPEDLEDPPECELLFGCLR